MISIESELKFISSMPSQRNKCIYGEVHTPLTFIDIMLDILPTWVYQETHFKWFDPCCGKGYFMMMICGRLLKGLETIIHNKQSRSTHILKNMIHMCEIQKEHKPYLVDIFGDTCLPHIQIGDFLNIEYDTKYDIIIGNPPFNIHGKKLIPSCYLHPENVIDTKSKPTTIWPEFIKKSLSMLSNGGFLCMVIPSIWLKPDNAGIHKLIFSRKYTIFGIRSFSCSEVIKLFHKQVQTPMSIVVLRNTPQPFVHSLVSYLEVPIYDQLTEHYEYIYYNINDPLPMHTPSIVQKMLLHARKYGTFDVIKTNMPTKNTYDSIEDVEGGATSYVGIKSCVFGENRTPYFTTTTSSIAYPYTGEPKIIMAHKMYGIPYYDEEGKYGISNRDNYIILQHTQTNTYTKEEMRWLVWFFSSPIVLFLFDTTRYRMRYLEKYAFEYIPDIMHKTIAGYDVDPSNMYDDTLLSRAFGLNEKEIGFISSRYKRINN